MERVQGGMMPMGETLDAIVASATGARVRILGGVETLAQSRQQTQTGESSPPVAKRAVRIGYLLSRYPAISHTFFLHEVLGLRSRGMHLETASINEPDRPVDQLPATEAAESKATYYVKRGSMAVLLQDLVATVIQSPGPAWRGLCAVARLPAVTLRQRGFWLFYLAEALLVGRWMKERKLNHLHVHFGGAVASVGMLTAAAWRIPFSLTIHGPEELLNVDAYHLRQKVEAADFVLCISDFCRSQLYQLTPPAHWNKFHVIRLGVDPLILAPPERPPERAMPSAEDRRALEIVCTGRLVAAKGHRILLQSVLLLQERGVRLRVTLIGGGPEREGLEAFVKAHALEQVVCFSGPLSHAKTLAHVRRADVFALASFAEGIPVALMEAMSLGVPCVSTAIAGIPELIRSGYDGLLVPPANEIALADALELLARDPKLRRTLGANARQRIICQYNLPLNQELLASTFEELAGAAEQSTHPENDTR